MTKKIKVATPDVPTPPPSKASKKVIAVASPDLTPAPEERGGWYWVGLLPSCPRSGVHVGGLAFDKVTETIEKVPNQQKGTRVPHPGCVMRLTPAKLELVAERIGRTILRTTHAVTERGGGENIGDRVRAVPYLTIPIPTPEELKAMSGLGRRRYKPVTPRTGDLPLGDYVFIVPAPDRRPRNMGHQMPEPVSKAGIVLADDPFEEVVDELVPAAPAAEPDKAELLK